MAAPAQPVDNNTFYTSLSPYGRWMEVDGYGMVWQPTVVAVDTGWQPYFNAGRWVYTDAGWYWNSDYSGLGALPLWALVPPPSSRLVLGARYHLGTFLGYLALFLRLLRLGSASALGLLPARPGFQLLLDVP